MLIAIGTLTISASALTADLPARTYGKAPVAVAPGYDWTGFCAGLNVGGAWNEFNPTSTTLSPPVNFLTLPPPPGGYNWQVNTAVLGIEADFNYFGVKGSSSGVMGGAR